MTPEQEGHLQSIKDEFSRLVDPKYRKGQEEHGGDLFEKNIIALLDSAIEEAIDQFVYLVTIKNSLLNKKGFILGKEAGNLLCSCEICKKRAIEREEQKYKIGQCKGDTIPYPPTSMPPCRELLG